MFPTLRYSVFGSLYRPSPDDLPRRLRLKYCWLLCERIDAAPFLCSGLLDDNESGKSGHKEGSRFLEFFVAYFRERLDDALDVGAGNRAFWCMRSTRPAHWHSWRRRRKILIEGINEVSMPARRGLRAGIKIQIY